MKTQMSQIGIGIAALSALAAEGKDFNRAELNAMLDRLAASPEPKVSRGSQATCYKIAMPQPERFECVCKECGMYTIYPMNTRRMANTLARFRDDATSDPIICGIDRIGKLAWVINGKRMVVDRYDARILRAFLTGEKTWREDRGDQCALKESLPRLQQLLGTATVK